MNNLHLKFESEDKNCSLYNVLIPVRESVTESHTHPHMLPVVLQVWFHFTKMRQNPSLYQNERQNTCHEGSEKVYQLQVAATRVV